MATTDQPASVPYQIDVVAPFHNERENLGPFVDELLRVLDRLPKEYECRVIFVNDGSTDGTGALLDAFADPEPGGGPTPAAVPKSPEAEAPRSSLDELLPMDRPAVAAA